MGKAERIRMPRWVNKLESRGAVGWQKRGKKERKSDNPVGHLGKWPYIHNMNPKSRTGMAGNMARIRDGAENNMPWDVGILFHLGFVQVSRFTRLLHSVGQTVWFSTTVLTIHWPLAPNGILSHKPKFVRNDPT